MALISPLLSKIAAAQAATPTTTSTTPHTPTEAEINVLTDIYTRELGRSPDASGILNYSTQLAGGRSVADITAEINNSMEGRNYDRRSVLNTLINRNQDFAPISQTQVVAPQVYSSRSLMGDRAPGGINFSAMAGAQAPLPFAGIPTALPRPAVNVSSPEGSAENVIENIMADRIGTGVINAEPGIVPVVDTGGNLVTKMKKGGDVSAQGIKSLAKSLPQYGRYNDDMVAHISSEEAALLESLGGAGTINPYTGLPEYGLGSFFQKTIMRPLKRVGKAVLKPVKEVAQALGPVGQIAATYFGGPMGAALYGGLASEGKFFDVKRGIMSGITAYGAQQLGAGLESAGGAETAVPAPGPEAIVDSGVASSGLAAGDAAASTGSLGATGGTTAIPTAQAATMGPPSSAMNFTDKLSNMASGAYDKAATGISSLTDPSTYTGIVDKAVAIPERLGNVGQGISNLLSSDPVVREAAQEAFKSSGATLMNTAAPILMGVTGQAAIDEADKMKAEQSKLEAEQNERDRRNRELALARMAAYKWQYAEGGSVDDESGVDGMAAGGSPMVAKYSGEDGSDVELPEYLRRTPDFEDATSLSRLRTNLKAMPAGDRAVAGRAGLDYDIDKDTGISAGLAGMAMKTPKGITGRLTQADIGLRRKLGAGQMHAGIARDLMGGKNRFNAGYTMNFEAGGQPRFLSGGGDGMSDSIPATIEGKQEARLADGEFVIPADVVSHLGNGSSKAGAKRLYSMMDKVRQARTGTTKQGKEINAMKYLPA